MTDDNEGWQPELEESQLHGIDPENHIEELKVPEQPARRRRGALPSMWSRVILIGEYEDTDIVAHEIERDLAAVAALPRPPPASRAGEWAPIFLPTEYARAHNDITLEHYQLGERRLRTLGEEISAHRARIRELALAYDKSLALELEQDLHEVSALA